MFSWKTSPVEGTGTKNAQGYQANTILDSSKYVIDDNEDAEL